MRVFVAGATGAIGSRLLPLLVSEGHRVVGSTRTPSHVASIQAAGAQAVVVDGLDAKGLAAAVLEAQPEVVIDEMTALRGALDLKHFDRTFGPTNRLRTDGLDHLLVAATRAGASRIIVQSFCGWPYERRGDPVKSEEAPLDPAPPRELRATLDAIRYLERQTAALRTSSGIVLRYGSLYGPGSGMLDPGVIRDIRRRRFPLIGSGQGWWSFLHVEDAARATALAVERRESGIYNIVDDDPAPVRAWLPALASMLGARRPLAVPKWLGSLLAGDHLVTMMCEVRAGSNAKAKRVLGWEPHYPSWREGFASALHETGTREH
jgi:nucleoside-diphosphate-sugar epimerase